MGGARFKLGRHGRRWGKSTAAFTAALTGHGPGWPESPKFKGVAQGFDVYWIPPDFSQAGTLWRTEVLPRLSGIAGVKVNNSDYSATFPNGAAFRLWSAENVRAIRGSGKRLGGVVLEEAAHWPCGSAWVREVRPALMDNRGWAWFISSTNSGSDGETDDRGNKITPSFFNRQCQEVLDGTAGEDWQETHGDARDNPKIHPDEFADMVKGYGNRHPSALQEEVYAALLTEGVGKAFPEWRTPVHVQRIETFALRDWTWFGGLDWGYKADGALTVGCIGPEGQVYVRFDWNFRELDPEEAGFQAGGKLMTVPPLAFLGCDSQMQALDGRPSHLEGFQAGLVRAMGQRAPQVAPVSKRGSEGKTHREHRCMLLHGLLAWSQEVPVEKLQPWHRPKITFHPDCTGCIRSIPALMVSPTNPEDVDTKGDDHNFDSLTYPLLLRPQGPPKPEKALHPDVMVLADGGRRRVGPEAYGMPRPEMQDQRRPRHPKWSERDSTMKSEDW